MMPSRPHSDTDKVRGQTYLLWLLNNKPKRHTSLWKGKRCTYILVETQEKLSCWRSSNRSRVVKISCYRNTNSELELCTKTLGEINLGIFCFVTWTVTLKMTTHTIIHQTAFRRNLSALKQFTLLLKFMVNPHSNSKLKIHTPPIPSCQHCQRPVSFTVLSRAVVIQDGLLKSFTCQSCPPILFLVSFTWL